MVKTYTIAGFAYKNVDFLSRSDGQVGVPSLILR
jgi:hypothetical protein